MSDSKTKSCSTDDEVRRLATILIDLDLGELEIEREGVRIYVSRQQQYPQHGAAFHGAGVAMSSLQHVGESSALAHERDLGSSTLAPVGSHAGTIRSPMVGVVYVASGPEAKPFVQVGSQVEENETLLIVEAMKVMNPIKSPRSGVVKHIWISDGTPVEFDEPLMVVE